MYSIELKNILDKHEELKKKGLNLNENDLRDWIHLQDNIIDLYIQRKSEYSENKIDLKVHKAASFGTLKNTLDDNGKKAYTDKTAEAEINKKFQVNDIELEKSKIEYELLSEKKAIISEYINLGKKIVFND